MAVSNQRTLKLDEKEIVLNESFIVPDGSCVTFDVAVEGNDAIKMKLSFKPEGASPRVDWQLEADNRLHITFQGWVSSLGTSLKKPARVGQTINGSAIGFMAYHHRIGDTNRVDFHVLLGGNYG